jgi:AraC-like DNA-binding protein
LRWYILALIDNPIVAGNYQFSIVYSALHHSIRQDVSLRSHKGLEINAVVEGSCKYYIDGNMLDIKKGDLIVFNSGAKHMLEVNIDEPCLFSVLQLDHIPSSGCFPSIGRMLDENPLLMNFISINEAYILIHHASSLVKMCKKLVAKLMQNITSFYANLLITEFLIEICRFYYGKGTSQTYEHVKNIQNYIVNEYRNISSLSDIAKFVGLEKSYMQRIFSQHMGMTIWEYVTLTRLNVATMLLKETDIPIGSIDQIIGFESRQSFYINFKKKNGISPNAYRKKYAHHNA